MSMKDKDNSHARSFVTSVVVWIVVIFLAVPFVLALFYGLLRPLFT